MATYVIWEILMYFYNLILSAIKKNLLVGVTAHVKNSWELPCLLKFGQLARMVVWVTSMHFRREAKLAEPFSRREYRC